MKMLTLSLMVICSTAYSSTKQTGFLLHTKLNYKLKSGKEISTSKDFILPKDNHTWVTLTDLKDDVILLGKMVSADKKTIKLEYLLIDGTVKPNGIVSSPSIVARLNERAEISVGHTPEKPDLSVSLLAQPTEFSSEK